MNASYFSEILSTLTDPLTIILLPVGVLVGIVFGVIPGLSGGVAMSMALPLVVLIDPPMAGISLMIGIYSADQFGGALTGILLGIPGTGGATASTIEGHQIAKQGKPGLAIAVARSAAIIGGVFGALVAIGFSPSIASIALQFGPAEYFALALFGVTIVASVSSSPLTNALISAFVGFLIATIGQDVVTGAQRFTGGSVHLLSGINIVWVIVGMFAIAQAFVLASGRQSIPQFKGKLHVPWGQGWGITWKDRKFVALGTGIGTFIGFIPGAGATMAAWMSYNEARRFSKNQEKFGKGNTEGLVAPEAATDAVSGGTLIPTMTLGIPGSAQGAIILGGLTLAGLQPGPTLFESQPGIAMGVLVLYLVASIVLFILATISIRFVLVVLRLDSRAWPPIIVALGLFGSFMVERRLFGLYAALALALVAYLLQRIDFPLPPLLLGFILGPLLESNFVRVMRVAGSNPTDISAHLMNSPIAMIFLSLAIVSAGWEGIRQIRKSRQLRVQNKGSA